MEGRAARRRLRRVAAGSSARRTRPPTRVIAVSRRRCATTCCAAYPDVDPAKVTVVHNGIDTDDWAPRRRPRPGARARRRPRPAVSVVFVGRITRQKGLPLLPARRRAAAARRPARAAAPARRTPRRSRPRCAAWSTSSRQTRDRRGLDRARCCPRADVVALLVRRDGVRLPVDLRAARHRQPRGDGLRDRGRRDRDRRHPRGRRRRRDRAGWCRSSRPPTAPAPRWTPTSTSPTSPRRSTRS